MRVDHSFADVNQLIALTEMAIIDMGKAGTLQGSKPRLLNWRYICANDE